MIFEAQRRLREFLEALRCLVDIYRPRITRPQSITTYARCVEEGSVPTPEVLVITELTIQHVLNMDGEPGLTIELKGDPDRTTVLGLLELVKQSVLNNEI